MRDTLSAGHCVQVAAPAAEKVPARHGDAATALHAEPAGQITQLAVSGGLSMYLPAESQACARAAHAPAADEPGGEVLPSAHCVQLKEPELTENVPAGHTAHAGAPVRF